MRRAILCVTLSLLAGPRVLAQDRSTPEATVRSFLVALESADARKAAACVRGVHTSGLALDDLSKQMREDPLPPSYTVSDVKTTMAGATATVTAQVSVKGGNPAKIQVVSTEVKLTLEDGVWYIEPSLVKALEKDYLNILPAMLIDPKVYYRAREKARAVYCLNNVKQLCLAAHFLAIDNDLVYKIKADTYKKSLMPYWKNEEKKFVCQSNVGKNESYAFNANLSGVSDLKVHDPANTVLIYEGKNSALVFRHDGTAAVGFVDGHAKLITAAEEKKLRWKP